MTGLSRGVHVEVTDDDVLAGERGNPAACPVAFAVARALQAAGAHGLYGRVIFTSGDPTVLAWIAAYDRGDEVGAFAFDLL